MSVPKSQIARSMVIVALGLFVLFAMALATTTWAAPPSQGTVPPTLTPIPPPTKTPKDINPGCGVVIVRVGDPDPFGLGCSKIINIPAGTVPTGTQVSAVPVNQPPCPATPTTPEGLVFLDHCYQVTWTGPNGQPLSKFNGDVLDCLPYSDDDLAQAGGKPENLLIGFYVDGNWIFVKPSTIKNGYVCAKIDKPFTYQALFTIKPKLPTTGDIQPPVRWELWAVLLGVAIVLLGSARYALKR